MSLIFEYFRYFFYLMDFYYYYRLFSINMSLTHIKALLLSIIHKKMCLLFKCYIVCLWNIEYEWIFMRFFLLFGGGWSFMRKMFWFFKTKWIMIVIIINKHHQCFYCSDNLSNIFCCYSWLSDKICREKFCYIFLFSFLSISGKILFLALFDQSTLIIKM